MTTAKLFNEYVTETELNQQSDYVCSIKTNLSKW